MSQIGYMILAAGLGPVGYAFAIFHLLTHGFFKAGMFLGAGSVMHGMDDQVDMRRFGGLARHEDHLGHVRARLAGDHRRPAVLRLLEQGQDHRVGVRGARAGSRWVFGSAALLGAGITAFYMTRLFFMTFQGERRWTDDVAPARVAAGDDVPLIVLAVGSVVPRSGARPHGGRSRTG